MTTDSFYLDQFHGFRAYRAYLGIRLHFQPDSKYDFFEKKGAVSATSATFNKRKDKWQFVKLDRDYPKYQNLCLFLAANFFHNEKSYIRKLNMPDAKNMYLDYRFYEESITYNFEKELSDLLYNVDYDVDMFKKLLYSNNSSSYPELFQQYVRGEVSPWFFILIDRLTDFVDGLNIEDPVIWQPNIRKLRSFQPFMSVNMDAIKKVFVKRLGI